MAQIRYRIYLFIEMQADVDVGVDPLPGPSTNVSSVVRGFLARTTTTMRLTTHHRSKDLPRVQDYGIIGGRVVEFGNTSVRAEALIRSTLNDVLLVTGVGVFFQDRVLVDGIHDTGLARWEEFEPLKRRSLSDRSSVERACESEGHRCVVCSLAPCRRSNQGRVVGMVLTAQPHM